MITRKLRGMKPILVCICSFHFAHLWFLRWLWPLAAGWRGLRRHPFSFASQRFHWFALRQRKDLNPNEYNPRNLLWVIYRPGRAEASRWSNLFVYPSFFREAQTALNLLLVILVIRTSLWWFIVMIMYSMFHTCPFLAGPISIHLPEVGLPSLTVSTLLG